MDVERDIIQRYFHLGYKYELITQLLKNQHNTEMSVRTLKRRLHDYARQLVATILRELDPESSTMRRMKRLRRRQYISQGPNQCWHIDGLYAMIFHCNCNL